MALRAAPLREIVIQAVFQGVLSAIVALICYTRAVMSPVWRFVPRHCEAGDKG